MNKIEEILKKDRVFTYHIVGVSMNPLLIQGRDLVTISSDITYLKKYDVVLYKRKSDQRLTLHRLIGIKENTYLILGDNCLTIEEEAKENVIGKMVGIIKEGKEMDLNSFSYQLYSRCRVFFFPIRKFNSKVRSFLRNY